MRFINEAKEAGFTTVEVAALVKNQDEVLLIRDSGEVEFHLPVTVVQREETIAKALARGLQEQTALGLKNVVTYLRHVDRKGVRQYIFIVEVVDPYCVQHDAYAWVSPEDGSGYPISDELRQTLNLL